MDLLRTLRIVRRASSPLGLLVLAAVPTVAQKPVSASLFTRVDDGRVRAAIEVEIEHGWHLYHDELGNPGAVGKPTRVTLGGEGITWGDVRFPEPLEFDQSEIEEGLWIWGHEGSIVLYAVGELADGAHGDDVTAKLDGLVCELSCIPYRETVPSEGAGSDELFAAFPADLLGAGAGDAQSSPPPPAPQPKAPAADQIESGRADATVYSRVEGGVVRAAIEIAIDPGWHLYHTEKGNPDGIGKPTELELFGAGIRWGEAVWPEPHEMDQSDIEDGLWIWGHEGTIVVYAEGELAPGARGDDVWVRISGQTCEESCVNYKESAVRQGPGPDALFRDFPSGEGGGEKEDQDLLTFLLLAVGWGLFTLLMPCTYPMIPITISFFTKQADSRGGNVLPLALAYGAGIVLVFIIIGVVFGSVIIPFATHPITNIVIGALFFYFALVLFGVVTLNPPRFLMNAAGKASSTGGFLGVFLMGTCLVVTSFTCTAPFVGSLLAVGAADGNLGRIVLGMGVFGLTMAIPFVVLSLVPGRIQAMPRSGEWMNTLKFTLGFVELAAAFKFFSNADVVQHWEVLSREVFLALWGVIFLAAGLYLFGVLRGRSKPSLGPKRLVSAGLLTAFAGYCLWGMTGREMDWVMTSIVPPYSGGRFAPELYGREYNWPIVLDDYDRAVELAKAQDKLLLVNFTGHT